MNSFFLSEFLLIFTSNKEARVFENANAIKDWALLSHIASTEVGEWGRWLSFSYVGSKNINLIYRHIEKNKV